MSYIVLGPLDLALAAVLVLALAGLTIPMRLGVAKDLLVSALRTTVQLLLVGLVLKWLFGHVSLPWMGLVALVMLGAAGREVMRRQHRRYTGFWGYGVGTVSMFISSFSVTVLALTVFIRIEPWYEPQYAIPLLGMMLGNTMTGISIALDRLTNDAWERRRTLEARLMLGHRWSQAVETIRKNATRSGMIPMINAMAAAGLVSLPGMMTGQILAGAEPVDAVKYQILIMFLISSGTGFGTIAAVWLGSRRLFDERERLRLDRLRG
jgi:putative ABC transport system permease protein